VGKLGRFCGRWLPCIPGLEKEIKDNLASKFLNKLDGWPSAVIGIAVLLAMVGYGFYAYRGLEAERARILSELEESRAANYGLLRIVREREETINAFQGQIDSIGSVVGTLEKLAKTDEELLKKYSKVYFLNENYTPLVLAGIEEQYLLSGSKNFMIHAQVWSRLRSLLDTARADGHNLLVASAYRSFDTQSSLKSAYTVTYGSGANRFSADQGYSEHQLGTAVDFTTEKLGANFSAFGSDPAYKWLLENAHRYGFILSYPPNNSYYKFEAWHWRYVGVSLATNLHDDGKYFYDLDQREIDRYLVKLFD